MMTEESAAAPTMDDFIELAAYQAVEFRKSYKLPDDYPIVAKLPDAVMTLVDDDVRARLASHNLVLEAPSTGEDAP